MNNIDIKENDLLKLDRELLAILLVDNTTKKNIIWATDNYEPLGDGYDENEPIAIDTIVGGNGMVIRPRVNKTRAEQLSRSKNKAEVFTPSWICNAQNNLVDRAWFGIDGDIFNRELSKGWETLVRPIAFPTITNKTWQDYVMDTRLEITCGEAPYLVSRYDTISGEPISVPNRVGLLDRKLRVVSENTSTKEEWLVWAKVAFQNTYGFEWQGDNLLLARENLLYTFIDYYQAKFASLPIVKDLRVIAKIISWNIWQMDGLKGVVPNSCTETSESYTDLFGEVHTKVSPCIGCSKGDVRSHNGIYCKIKDWETGGTKKFISLLK